MTVLATMLSLCLSVLPSFAAEPDDGIFIEAESFSDAGGWCIDQQFMDIMGSPYLIAHGASRRVQDATTSVDISEPGVWYAYVRTYNWTSPWSSKPGPGRFQLAFNGRPSGVDAGITGNCWEWQYAGKFKLGKGTNRLSLVDMSGFDGRCDAVWLTMEKDILPPSDKEALERFRRKSGAISHDVAADAEYDFVVIGAGIAGMCAAMSAARGGCRVALVNDRPVVGGCNSSEIRVHLGGMIEKGKYPALGRMIREFGHSTKGNANPAEYYEDSKKFEWLSSEKNITLYTSTRAVAVSMEGNRIASVICRNIGDGREFTLTAPIFADCTGDASIGCLAGADWRSGRESRKEFGESLAPEEADDLTMGASVQWYSTDYGRKVSFPEFEYGISFNDTNCEKVTMGEWTWETGMNRDQVLEAEYIRDYGLLVVYSNWSFLKNHSEVRSEYATRNLDWVAYVAGKRESRRLLGDYVLHQDDIDKNVFHEDASFATTWSIDLHFPEPRNSGFFPGNEFKASTKHIHIYPYSVPYRCLYSRNVDNLFMAGRNISVTHVALGTVRVMRTTGMMGEVVGMAASICHRHGHTPRQVYTNDLEELKSMMEEGASRGDDLPDNQNFNQGKSLDCPRAFLK